MKTIRQYIDLIEAHGVIAPYDGDGPLWHGTDLLALAGIIASNEISRSIDADGYNTPEVRGVSLTTDQGIAWSFADRSSYIFSQNHCHAMDEIPGKPSVPTRGAVIEFSAQKLRTKFKLVHYEDDDNNDEEEIRVMCLGISPVLPFITGFGFDPDDLKWFLAYCDTRDCSHDYSDTQSLKTNLMNLVRHPLFQNK